MCLAAHLSEFLGWTPVNVKLLLPPRQSRGNSHLIRLIEGNARLFIVHELNWPAVGSRCRDPKDDKFLALAAECEASILVSSDEDLLELQPWNEVRIVRPAAFLLEGK